MYLNIWSQLEALFGKAIEPLNGGTFLEEILH